MMYYNDDNERENRLLDIPLTEELKKTNPEIYDEIVRLRQEIEADDE